MLLGDGCLAGLASFLACFASFFACFAFFFACLFSCDINAYELSHSGISDPDSSAGKIPRVLMCTVSQDANVYPLRELLSKAAVIFDMGEGHSAHPSQATCCPQQNL